MTQKDKVKELVGRGLDSYHTKSLQQIDRIEKKNKEQNHKISILSNELDNDYLTKTEEGSVISLEHSKEGMVYLDELQGNTLVNYCTDGSKEMTLNGDIDVEGTFVTTTEGVDNGKVDVMCEGNTLVNIANHPNAFTVTRTEGQTYRQYDVPLLYPLKPETTYTIYLTIDKNEFDHNPFTSIVIGQGNTDNWSYRIFWNKEFGKTNTDKGLGRHKAIFTTHSRIGESSHKWIKFIFEGYAEFNTTIKDIVLIQGEHNENIDNFVGMKSVAQDDTNGHKIEILSRNKNHVLSKPKTVAQDIVSHDIYLEPNKEYSISSNVPYNGGLCMISKNHSHTNPIFTFQDWGETVNKFTTPNNLEKGIYSLVFWKSQLSADDNSWTQVELGKTITNYIPYNSNKKEILINEPLRSTPNAKDRFVKIGNKWFIERNCKVQTLNGSEGWSLSNENNHFICNQHRTDALGDTNIPIVCDKIIVTTHQILDNGEGYGINLSYYLRINLKDCDAKNGATVEQFIQKLQSNPVTIVYPLKTPIYEPLEIEPTLNTYNDTTHISNNSIIPCNMKIQNSGYNAIIKPSTLYTIALDTNKSGTIGMNLGRVKGTTTNNVLTLSTPATLTDDSLRLYGKGIKGSKVRILEGDKTNWIPSFFEGMKSSFEDKIQDDGSYKMEILMNNENLFDITKLQDDSTEHHIAKKNNANGFTLTRKNTGSGWNYSTWELPFKLKANTKYTISCKINKSNINSKPCCRLYDFTLQKDYAMLYSSGKYEFTTPINGYERIKLLLYSSIDNVTINEGDTVDFNDIKISEVKNGDFVNHQSNKIQFSSIEPLRGLPSGVKDRFLFKDNKLMIERNIGQTVLNGSENWRMERHYHYTVIEDIKPLRVWIGEYQLSSDRFTEVGGNTVPRDLNIIVAGYYKNVILSPKQGVLHNNTTQEMKEWLSLNPTKILYQLETPTYEEIPFELQKIILEGYENGTLFFDTNIPPTSTVTYAGETPIVKATKLNKTEVLNNTNDINDNIIPYLMDMDYRVVCLQLQSEEFNDGVAMARLFGGAYEMLQRDIQSKRYSVDEYRYRLDAYLNANKITEDEYNKLGDMLNE